MLVHVISSLSPPSQENRNQRVYTAAILTRGAHRTHTPRGMPVPCKHSSCTDKLVYQATPISLTHWKLGAGCSIYAEITIPLTEGVLDW